MLVTIIGGVITILFALFLFVLLCLLPLGVIGLVILTAIGSFYSMIAGK